MPDNTDAQILQIICRQGRQDCPVDLIFAECRLIPFEAKAPQPTPDVHHRALTLAVDAAHPLALLRARHQRPRCRAAKQRDELAPPHSITSSARASSVGGTSRPSALAVLRLITSSYLVGASTGRSRNGPPAGSPGPRYIRGHAYAPKICWRTRPRPESIGFSSKIQASRGRGLVAVTGRQGRSASLPAAARDVHVPVRPARRRAGAGRPRRGELPAALRALVFGPPALLAAAAGADRPDRPHAQDRRRFRPPQWLLRPPQPAHRHHPAGARRHLCPLHGGALRPDHGAAP